MCRDPRATEQAPAPHVHHIIQQLRCPAAHSGNDTKQLPWKITEILRGRTELQIKTSHVPKVFPCAVNTL